MRLSTIKLVGFKSFVEPTKIPFPDQMTCVVGPNGCGKSNVIDAVRWVLGESSAKNLRGDAMTDVIFNGSTSRKPISQASVELVFDNTQGRLADTFASRNQVSIKRAVNREGMSFYFLNGSKCRKRDITDIFLGTGLGPRSYAIIEQGMISRLIESKPHELRTFIEEAAGVSKYKERRRETETRIRSTRENLERLLDVRQELQSQLDKLNEQSEQAKSYSQFKAQERCLKSELAVLRWQKLQLQIAITEDKIRKLEQEVLFYQQAHVGHEDVLGSLKSEIDTVTEKVSVLQTSDYKTTTELTRFETQKVHLQQKKQELIAQSEQCDLKVEALKVSQETLEKTKVENTQAELLAQEKLEIAQLSVAENESCANALYQKNQGAFKNWQTLQKQFHEYEKQTQKNELNIDKILNTLELNEKQQQDCEHQLNQLEQQNSAPQLAKLQTEQIQLKSDLAQQQLAQNKKQSLINLQIQKQQTLQNTRTQLHTEINQQEAQLKALSDIVNHVELDKSEQLQAHSQDVMLFSQLKIQNGFELAIEHALQQFKNAKIFEDFDSIKNQGHRIWRNDADAANKIALARKVTSGTFPDVLEHIAVIENEREAKSTLKDTNWFACIDKQGTLFGRNWILDTQIDESASLILKAKKIISIERRLAELKNEFDALELNFKDQTALISELKDDHEALSKRIHQLTQQDVAVFTRLDVLQSQTQRWQIQVNEITLKLKHLQEHHNRYQDELKQAKSLTGDNENEQLQSKTYSAEREYEKAKQELKLYQQQFEQLKNAKHEASLAFETIKNTLALALNQLAHIQKSLDEALTLQKSLIEQNLELASPINSANEQIQLLLAKKQTLKVAKIEQEQVLIKAKEDLMSKERGQKNAQAELDKIQKKLQQLQIEKEGSVVRASSLLEPLIDLNTNLETVLNHLPASAKGSIWQTRIDELALKIAALGPINLAAIDEYEKAKNRKEYLDEQYQDLFDALNTLETAIQKIDKETKNRFKETFDAINEGLKELFPKVFGGGHAYLELTSDDLLESGVTIMARPPGKKNATIHLLSGGEKALTALSLVFSIFRLNPAPFCMLDEVDAPLDDANVGRFCRLVEEMSQSVQFIYISHNKIAMEMAGSLVGVTMGEPGVSRMVAVDIDQAVEMAVN
jgi:chromosome segregation protein